MIHDFGYDGRTKGWYDAQCVGEATDYCRWVGDPAWFACTLSGEQEGSVMERIGDDWYTHPGLYEEEDFVMHQGGSGVHKKCSDPSYIREREAARRGGFFGWVGRMLDGAVGSAGAMFDDPWSACIYTHDVLDNGFDAHEPTYEALHCQKTENGTVLFKGFVQCYNGATNCFFQLHWGLSRVLTGVAMAVLPFECRPEIEQHITGYTGTNERPVKVAVRPDGNVVLLSDGGLMSWFLRIEGETEEGALSPDTATGTRPAEVATLKPWTPPAKPFVAINIPMTSNKLAINDISESPLMRIVLPSLMRALTTDLVKFNVVVYAGYDTKDEFWVNAQKMDRMFTTNVDMGAGHDGRAKGTLTLKWIQCDCDSMVCNTNCISRIAYRDGADYFFRSNDDTEFMTNIVSTHNWISSFAAVLAEYDPPNVGVVGPICRQGNQEILTHDFVHRNHMDIFFQSYYPTLLSNWWCDDWITTVYGVQRTTKHEGVEVYHHTFVSRYEVDYAIHNSGDLVQVIDDGVGQIRAWLDKFLTDSLMSAPSPRDSIVFFMEGEWPQSIARNPDGPVLLVTSSPPVGGDALAGDSVVPGMEGWASETLELPVQSSPNVANPAGSFNGILQTQLDAKHSKGIKEATAPPAAADKATEARQKQEPAATLAPVHTPPAGDANGGNRDGSSVAEKLTALWALTEKGILSKDEFQSKKADLLARI